MPFDWDLSNFYPRQSFSFICHEIVWRLIHFHLHLSWDLWWDHTICPYWSGVLWCKTCHNLASIFSSKIIWYGCRLIVHVDRIFEQIVLSFQHFIRSCKIFMRLRFQTIRHVKPKCISIYPIRNCNEQT